MRPSMVVLPITISVFGAVWFALVVPGMAGSEWWQGLSVYGKWVVYNAGMFAVITGLFGGLVSIILSHRLSVVQMLVNGLAGFMVFSFVLDVYQPPYVIDKAGTWLITGGDTLAEAASDFMVATAWEALGAGGSMLYYLTYIVTPIMVVIGAVFLFGLNRFTQLFAEAI